MQLRSCCTAADPWSSSQRSDAAAAIASRAPRRRRPDPDAHALATYLRSLPPVRNAIPERFTPVTLR